MGPCGVAAQNAENTNEFCPPEAGRHPFGFAPVTRATRGPCERAWKSSQQAHQSLLQQLFPCLATGFRFLNLMGCGSFALVPLLLGDTDHHQPTCHNLCLPATRWTRLLLPSERNVWSKKQQATSYCTFHHLAAGYAGMHRGLVLFIWDGVLLLWIAYFSRL